MLYSEKVMDHLAHPRNVGEMENADAIGEVGNMKCGDIMKIYLKINTISETLLKSIIDNDICNSISCLESHVKILYRIIHAIDILL